MNTASMPPGWEDDSQFRITATAEILSELRRAQEQRSLLTTQYGNSREYALTALLDIDGDAGTLTLDACQNPAEQKKVLAAHTLTLETEVQRIRIRFASGRATPVTYQGRPAMQIAVPASMLRIQRREAYRIDTPVNEAVHCRFPHPTLTNREITLRVADISVKGMGLTSDPGLWPVQHGARLTDCRVDLPETGVVICDATVVRVFDDARGGKHRLWVGCQFERLPGAAGTLLQKYILKLERARLARWRGV